MSIKRIDHSLESQRNTKFKPYNIENRLLKVGDDLSQQPIDPEAVEIPKARLPMARLAVAKTLVYYGYSAEDAARAVNLLEDGEPCPDAYKSKRVTPDQYLGW
jgi:hypothetical protein